ncbi:phospholipase D [Paxillus ammoniavirescens]|nr:phospholipase D [Paxillus ammoniavirescens]
MALEDNPTSPAELRQPSFTVTVVTAALASCHGPDAHLNEQHELTPIGQPQHHTPSRDQHQGTNPDPQTSHGQRPAALDLEQPSSSPTTPVRSPKGTVLGTPRLSLPDTPSARTGPPRSLSFQFAPSNSPTVPHVIQLDGQLESPEIFENDLAEGDYFPLQPGIQRRPSSFRGALEPSPNLEKEPSDKKGKARENRGPDEGWNPVRRFHEPSAEEKPPTIFEEVQEHDPGAQRSKRMSRHQTTVSLRKDNFPSEQLQRTQSHPPQPVTKRSGGSAKWGKLRALIPSIIRQLPSSAPTHSVVTPQEVNITDELITGGLSTLMLKLWFDRDDKGHRRIPVLLHRLRIRISDSLHPLHAHKAVFRIECEYANGAVRWVVYRQLRDFISLHTHYTISNAFTSNKDALPEFPRTSLPYFKFLKRESSGGQVRRTDFALLQRQALEDYLINLIRAVMFHPSSNRLSCFLEISALFISLAPLGGAQYKAGFLRLETSGNASALGRKSLRWRERKESRWCSVRESYLVILEDAGEVTVWDVFLLDSDFKIVRPIRYYRKGLHLLRPEPADREFHTPERVHEVQLPEENEVDCLSAMDSIKSRLSRALGIGHRSTPNINVENQNDQPPGPPRHIRHDSASSGSSVPSNFSRSPTPLVDPSTNVDPRANFSTHQNGNEVPSQPENERRKPKKRSQEVSKHTFYVENSQMRLKLFARNERQMLQWITALEKAAATCHYVTKNRFDSFAPIRLNVATQWLVDGRDYMWNLSRALTMAKDSIYIHDWWLSPELQMRRPNKEKYRLDKILERKAKEGVKIYIILYQEVSSRTTPIDSNYTKQKLSSLHKNIMIQRSPSHFQTGTFYWAHHEKLCVIDQTIAFMGGIDLCFGRWDTPQHVIVDDPELSSEKTEIWPGKDYSNPRVLDFHTLSKPEEDMYDRTKVPRMPWHDVGMQIVGQPARDLARHFVERWNWLLRIKNHTRPMPFLLPPPEFKPGELAAMRLTGTCEMQICRSAGPWSLGTPNRIEHSIQDAYLKAIEMSEHFVYIENQFFISSTVINDVKIENKIGDALVRRIIRAHRLGTLWKCCIIIPLFPGFPFPIEHTDASAIRIIVDCQNHTLFRGPNSIHSRLRKEGIDPNDYIAVFSLRSWAQMRDGGVNTEIVYVHSKVCIVDDRLAIIGSANINERSQRGDRDSELAAVIRDTDMLDGTMAGRPFKVGRFAHTLRLRLMREHLGVDVDALAEEDYLPREEIKPEHAQEKWDPEGEQKVPRDEATHTKYEEPVGNVLHAVAKEFNRGARAAGDAAAGSTAKALQMPTPAVETQKIDSNIQGNPLPEEHATRTPNGKKQPGLLVPTLEDKVAVPQADGQPATNELDALEQHQSNSSTRDPPETYTANGEASRALANKNDQAGDGPPHPASDVSDVNEEKSASHASSMPHKHLGNAGDKAWALPTLSPHVDPDSFEDPVSDDFWKNVWVACAVHNTEIYRKVFHVVPDDTVTTWKQYTEFVAQQERLTKPAKDSSPSPMTRGLPDESAPYQHGGLAAKNEGSKETFHSRGRADSGAGGLLPTTSHAQEKELSRGKSVQGAEPMDNSDREEMEKLLKETRGHLVIHPTRFLEGEDAADNFLFNTDKLLPLPIYD